jgi:hypothetical protein
MCEFGWFERHDIFKYLVLIIEPPGCVGVVEGSCRRNARDEVIENCMKRFLTTSREILIKVCKTICCFGTKSNTRM